MDASDIVKYIAGLNHSIDELEGAVQPMVAKLLDELLAAYGHLKEEVLGKINTLNNYTYTLISVVFSQLKAQGVDTDAHPIKAELQRIQGYMKRAKQIATQQELEEEADKKRQQQAKEYIEQALGVKGGELAPLLLAQPAISTGNFDEKESSSTKSKEALELTTEAKSEEKPQVKGKQQNAKLNNAKLKPQKGKQQNKVNKPNHNKKGKKK